MVCRANSQAIASVMACSCSRVISLCRYSDTAFYRLRHTHSPGKCPCLARRGRSLGADIPFDCSASSTFPASFCPCFMLTAGAGCSARAPTQGQHGLENRAHGSVFQLPRVAPSTPDFPSISGKLYSSFMQDVEVYSSLARWPEDHSTITS